MSLVNDYYTIKGRVIEAGYGDEINWQADRRLEDVDEVMFLNELAWVILCSGMRVAVIQKKFPAIREAFLYFDAGAVAQHHECVQEEALKIFNSKSKIGAIIQGVLLVRQTGWPEIKKLIEREPIATLQGFPYIGPVTSYHLAKNLGVQVAKPDRHLVRIANAYGYEDVQKFCAEISRLSGDNVPVVDIVWWRYATLEPDYLNRIGKVE